MARAGYWLTPPTRLTFIVSVVLMILALLVHYAHVSIASALVWLTRIFHAATRCALALRCLLLAQADMLNALANVRF